MNSYSFTTILASDNIGDSLTNINNNYNNLNSWLFEFQNSYNENWTTILDFYNQYGEQLNNAISLVQNKSASWIDFNTTVKTNSSKWLQTFTVFYPTLLISYEDGILNDQQLNEVTSWVNTSFPIINEDSSINYTENQQLIISCYTYTITDQTSASFNHEVITTCSTSNAQVCVNCSDTWSGVTYCGYDTPVSCDATVGCSNCQQSDCHFLYPYLVEKTQLPITNTTTLRADSRINADVFMYVQDRAESTTLVTIVYNVVDCQWKYIKYLGI
jgi:hypothetical protein